MVPPLTTAEKAQELLKILMERPSEEDLQKLAQLPSTEPELCEPLAALLDQQNSLFLQETTLEEVENDLKGFADDALSLLPPEESERMISRAETIIRFICTYQKDQLSVETQALVEELANLSQDDRRLPETYLKTIYAVVQKLPQKRIEWNEKRLAAEAAAEAQEAARLAVQYAAVRKLSALTPKIVFKRKLQA